MSLPPQRMALLAAGALAAGGAAYLIAQKNEEKGTLAYGSNARVDPSGGRQHTTRNDETNPNDRGTLQQPAPQRSKPDNPDQVYTKSPSYADSYEKSPKYKGDEGTKKQ